MSPEQPPSPSRGATFRRPAPAPVGQAPRSRWSLLYVLGAVVVVGLLGIPRAVTPSDPPMPRVVWSLHAAQERAEAALVPRPGEALPLSVRVVGELLRRLGQSEAAGDLEASRKLRQEIVRAAKRAAGEVGGRPLLALRAMQTRLFLDAIQEYRVNGEASAELYELSGALLDKAKRAGWCTGRELRASDAELRAMFRIRWSELTALSSAAAFQPTLNDFRLYHGHRLRYPDAGPGRTDRVNAQLADVRALGKLDATYPADFAAGILFYRLGSVDQALESFRAHLRAHPDGAWTLRARNYATACAEQLFAR